MSISVQLGDHLLIVKQSLCRFNGSMRFKRAGTEQETKRFNL